MEEMKFVENPEVNDKVVEIVETLKEDIISNFHPKSIILSGSFGKGEVTAIEEGGCLQFLSDCEIVIVPNKYIFNQNKIKQFSENFYERTGLKVTVSGVILSIYLLFPILSRKLKPTIENYDLKWGSKVIYGENYLDRIPNFKPEEIPLWEGIRLLFNRMAEALEHFSLENPSKEMVFWTDKIVFACQDTLLLSIKMYHHSFKVRNNMFQELFPKYFKDLKNNLPNFLELTIKATKSKLNGTTNVIDPVEYWFDAAEICDKVFRYVIKKEMEIEFGNYLEFQERYLRHPKIKGFSRGFFSHTIYQNLITVTKLGILYRRPSFKFIKKIKSPWKHILYSMVPLAYFGIANYKVNINYLIRIKELLIELDRKINISKDDEFAKYLRKQFLDTWCEICCGI